VPLSWQPRLHEHSQSDSPWIQPRSVHCPQGDDYYIATSTFEWFPGVQIHHSRDLVNWRLLTRPLRRASQLNMLGDPDSCGVWAPCLTYADGLFWLIYTDVKRFGRTSVAGAGGSSLRDFHNYLVTCPSIDGEWSDPVYLNSSGFDPSLFHAGRWPKVFP
jgi:xylan 1,4-beta-xylosidase